MKNSITEYFRGILQVQAEPPRQVKYVEVLRVVLKERSMKFVLFFGLFIALPFFLVSTSVKSSDRIFFLLVGLIL